MNSLGDATCRPIYRDRLQEFLRGLDLDAETRRRVEINPLRVLDDKRPQVAGDGRGRAAHRRFSCALPCREHYDAVRGFLRDLGVEWDEAPRLVRGLDYYTRTTFEFVPRRARASQSAVGRRWQPL